MNFVERALSFECAGERLIAVLAEPALPHTVGVLIIVGGPQYRAGSHRQFVLLSRYLASQGFVVMRFDFRGMGDATGPLRSFDTGVPEIGPDIAAALNSFQELHPYVNNIVLWGMCDAASAALIYWHTTNDARVSGLVLVNPWVRTRETLGAARLKYYYRRQILDRVFWAKLMRGDIPISRALKELLDAVVDMNASRWSERRREPTSFQDRMADGLGSFAGHVLLILSGHDLVAKEFQEYVRGNTRWNGLLERANVEQHMFSGADHTFSSAHLRGEVEAMTSNWLKRHLPEARP